MSQFKRRDIKEEETTVKYFNMNVHARQIMKVNTELLKYTKSEIEQQKQESLFPPLGIYYRPSKPRAKGLSRLPYGFKRQLIDAPKQEPREAFFRDNLSNSQFQKTEEQASALPLHQFQTNINKMRKQVQRLPEAFVEETKNPQNQKKTEIEEMNDLDLGSPISGCDQSKHGSSKSLSSDSEGENIIKVKPKAIPQSIHQKETCAPNRKAIKNNDDLSYLDDLLEDDDLKNNEDFTESEDDVEENVIEVKNQAESKIYSNGVMSASVKLGHKFNKANNKHATFQAQNLQAKKYIS